MPPHIAQHRIELDTTILHFRRSEVEERTTKMTLLNINFQNDVIQKCLQKNGYQNPL
jgi:hypothetical protein